VRIALATSAAKVTISGTGAWRLFDTGGASTLVRAEGGNDEITGTQLTDRIEGGRGNDVMRGADGDDTLVDAQGHNRLDGGNGARDNCQFNARDSSAVNCEIIVRQ
jgi:Ca2+-binding RTX toxin-like protein